MYTLSLRVHHKKKLKVLNPVTWQDKQLDHSYKSNNLSIFHWTRHRKFMNSGLGSEHVQTIQFVVPELMKKIETNQFASNYSTLNIYRPNVLMPNPWLGGICSRLQYILYIFQYHEKVLDLIHLDLRLTALNTVISPVIVAWCFIFFICTLPFSVKSVTTDKTRMEKRSVNYSLAPTTVFPHSPLIKMISTLSVGLKYSIFKWMNEILALFN